jgi:hypothetical protein
VPVPRALSPLLMQYVREHNLGKKQVILPNASVLESPGATEISGWL